MFRQIPNITKNLLIINVLAFIASYVLRGQGVVLNELLGLHFVMAEDFRIYQLLTYMFMHANLSHIFCNMFALWMFGPVIENEWGSKRFALYYLVCGLGAAITQEVVWALMGGSVGVTIGASGAVFGILFAFGWLFPDVPMFLFFIPIPIRARVFVTLYAAFELFAGLAPTTGDNVAHFAHLGGMLFGWLLILCWKHIKFNKKPKISKKDYSTYHYHPKID